MSTNDSTEKAEAERGRRKEDQELVSERAAVEKTKAAEGEQEIARDDEPEDISKEERAAREEASKKVATEKTKAAERAAKERAEWMRQQETMATFMRRDDGAQKKEREPQRKKSAELTELLKHLWQYLYGTIPAILQDP